MKKRLQELFAVTDHGAGQLLYACLTGFLVYVAELSPLALMMYYIGVTQEGIPFNLYEGIEHSETLSEKYKEQKNHIYE